MDLRPDDSLGFQVRRCHRASPQERSFRMVQCRCGCSITFKMNLPEGQWKAWKVNDLKMHPAPRVAESISQCRLHIPWCQNALELLAGSAED